MKNIFTIIVLFTCLSLGAQSDMKVITYNVLEGLGNEATYGKGRRDSCVQWLDQQQADVIGLQEFYGSEAMLQEDSKRWEHNYFVKSGGVALTSRKPIEVIKIYSEKGLANSVIHCRTFGVDFLVIHLSPSDWKYRLNEAHRIESIVDSVRLTTDKYIVLGDFNSHSPFDGELYNQNPELVAKYQKGDRMNKAKGSFNRNTVNGRLDYSVMSKFLSFPLIDVTEHYVPLHNRFSFPTPILIGVWRTAGNIGRTPERIDYILCSKELSPYCKNVIIHNGEDNDYISDHYPVEAIFDLNSQ
ncbi:endonuclease/exonuclease/phosphatase family protein [Membranihabitans marinus]|uniref:endonuclease/exonuclease/phosphatase family protein n=1 Tax=Membranihabitans marinus TaxID=1227546 RepID=UPI001F1F411D|nr:endonuclease/exonuclease/phosphatase family protein [Membranihabitans marinus]